jgi:hypothetical protein
MTTPQVQPEAAQMHELLLRLAGHVADELVTSARDWLGKGRSVEAARVVTACAESGWFEPTTADVALLTTVDPRIDAAQLRQAAQRAGAPSAQDWEFAPAIPVAGTPTVVALDLTTDDIPLDRVDAAAARAAAGTEGAIALWRAWRAPDDIHPEISRVFLLSTTAPLDALPQITAVLHEALRAVDFQEPQVEVFRPDLELAWYQRKARGRSALLWADTPPVPVAIARDFDSVSPVLGPSFEPDHPTLSAGDEPRLVLDFLKAGDVLLATTARERDVFDSSLGDVVSQNFRTDGTWIWTDSVTYYLETYGLSPDPTLLGHIRNRGYVKAELDDVSRHRAMVELFRPVTEGSAA